MKHISTWDLLDLAEDVKDFAKKYHGDVHSLATATRLAEIDTELLSRMPEEEFVTVLDDNGNPVGFEPECYVRLSEAQEELLDADYAADQIIGLDLGV